MRDHYYQIGVFQLCKIIYTLNHILIYIVFEGIVDSFS